MADPDKPSSVPALASRPGEVLVWFTTSGVTVGLAMILGLLGVVIWNGIGAFWPRRVVEATVVEGAVDMLQGSRTFAGEEVHRGPKAGTGVGGALEIQLFIGNKDVYGMGFKFVDVASLESMRWPKDLMRIERVEYGPAFGVPLSITGLGARDRTAEARDFNQVLGTLVREAMARRREIQEIEKTRIGAINREMEDLQRKQRTLIDRGATDEAKQSITGRIKALEVPYNALDERRRALRELQAQGELVYRLPSGAEQKVRIGNILHFTYPNAATVTDRMLEMVRNIGLFLSEEPREANTEGGIFPAIFGTFVMTLLMSMAVMPFGVVAAIYLREYAAQGAVVRAVRIAVNNLAGVPSIVFGVFGLGFFVYLVGGTVDSLFFSDRLPTPTVGTGGIMWSALTLALMTVPVVIVSTEEALAAVPRSVREGSLACGASKWQTIQRVVLPAAAPGVLTGLILAMARGAGEVAPLMLVGVVKLAPEMPLDLNFPFIHLDQKFMHLGFHIYDLGFQSPDSEAAKPMVFATTLFLIALIVLLNLSAIYIRERLRKRYATGAF
jgi:phosphate transport system permease protein